MARMIECHFRSKKENTPPKDFSFKRGTKESNICSKVFIPSIRELANSTLVAVDSTVVCALQLTVKLTECLIEPDCSPKGRQVIVHTFRKAAVCFEA
jgi:hypothetical protein